MAAIPPIAPFALRRLLSRDEFSKLTAQQRIALGLDDDQSGAPSDFNGTVLPNPDHLRLYEDTESGIEPTRLPTGVKFLGDLAHGEMPRDVSNPAPAELVAPAMREVAAKSEGKPVSTAATVPVFSPDGTLGDIPQDQLMTAVKSGAKPGISIKSPDGKIGVVPADRIHDAVAAGGQLLPYEQQEMQHAGGWHALYSDVLGLVKSLPTAARLALSSDPNDLAERKDLIEKTADQMSQSWDERKAEGRGAPYRVGAAANEMLGVNVKGEEQSAKEGDVRGVLGHAAAVPVVMAATAGLDRAGAEVKPIVSELAKAAADRAVRAVKNVTPKQAAAVAGTATGAIVGKGVTSAYFGSKFGHVAEMLFGKERANTPIFQKAASLDEAADALAETIARDRAAQTQAGALGNLPATSAKPAAQTGEALATGPVSTNLTPEAKATSSAPRFTLQDRVAAKSLLEDALKTHTGDVIDQVVPGKNTAVKSRVEFYLKKGDVAGAEAALDKGAKAWKNLGIDRQAQAQAAQELGSTSDPQFLDRAQQIKEQMMAAAGTNKPAWTALDRQPVPSTNEIRARVQREAAAPKPGTRADLMEDKGIDQQWQWHLDRHGWAAESEARREFIARNSTGMTKGELAKRFAARKSGSAAQTAAAPAAAPGTAAAASPENDLTSILEKSLDAVRKAQK